MGAGGGTGTGMGGWSAWSSGSRVGTRAAMKAWLCAHRLGSMPAGGSGRETVGRGG